MGKGHTLSFTAVSADMRLDKFLAENQGAFTRSGLQKLFEAEAVLVNGTAVAKNYKLKTGDKIEIQVTQDELEANLTPQDLPLNIVFEDESIAVINKEKGMVVHPSPMKETGTLVNALLYRYGGGLSRIGGELRPGIVHRIDKDTSGLLVIAKNDHVHLSLAKQAEEHTMLRLYSGVVRGGLKDDAGTVDAPIGRNPINRTKYRVLSGGRRAVTHYTVLMRYTGYTLLEFMLETGRTHQIRVHMAHIGHPVMGDAVYGAPLKGLNGQCLHAKTLGFTHPVTGERLTFASELPHYFEEFLKRIYDPEEQE